MENSLKTQVFEVVSALKSAQKDRLADKILENWDKSLLEYSRILHSHKSFAPLESTFARAFSMELERLGYDKPTIQNILKYLENHRNLQTTPHISPAQKPRYFFINYMHSLCLGRNDYFLVAMFSGVPFSNATRPGRLSSKISEVNLIPSVMQDALVYQSKIPEKLQSAIKTLPNDVQKILPEAKLDADFTAFAVRSAQALESPFLHGKPIFFDFNEVAKNYFLISLDIPTSPLYKILFDPKNLSILESEFKEEVFFYRPNRSQKYEFVESYYLKSKNLQSNKNKIILTPESLKKELAEKSLCVGMPLGFLIYSFLNGFLCGGSFAQTEYLPQYKQKFMKIPFLSHIIKNSPDGALTTGGFFEDLSLCPLDIYLQKNENKIIDLKKYDNTLFGQAILAIKDVLLYQNYSNKYEEKIMKKTTKKNQKTKVHLIGICGKGMSGLAIMLKQKGFEVTGSDEGFYEPVSGLLRKNKIKILSPHKPENISPDVDVVVIGRHAKLVSENNKEVMEAFARGIVIKSLPEAIGDLLGGKENTVVVGSFGKSTMTALIAYILQSAKKDPSYFIGAVPHDFKENAHLGKGKHFIIEGDEYPSAHWDHTSKMLYMNPKNAVLISGEHDHLNVFPDENSYLAPFLKFAELIPKDGLMVACKHEKNVLKITKKTKARVVYYGIHEDASYHATNISYGAKTTFDLYNGKKKITTLTTKLLGRHNIENIIGACAFVLEKKLVSVRDLQNAIAKFKGLSGRLDQKPAKSSIMVYEGFGSSYIKAKSIFEALSLHFAEKRLVTVFEPHTFSWRNHQAKSWYEDIFDSSNIVLILPPPVHGSDTHDQITQQEIVEIVKKHKGENVFAPEDADEALAILKKVLHKDDLVALVTSGSLMGLTESIPNLVSKYFPK